ncbi:hypothetical protein CI105_03780 [Candidatus Izimaplasma bacterium ZiA1]|uniref:VTT domain-containing protein n=1 Tax=Candidatus Izimoplasma sp. ZiA1 TaxID=2024899 RepID=UPI000BAA5FFB|nr:hypothetical protein CI105_03780 [Candidatus Izimaplasma bacterium ZiA1]
MEYLSEFINQALIFLGDYGFIIVILFGITHPSLSAPVSIFTLTLSLTLLGYFYGYIVLLGANAVGILIFYYFVRKFDVKRDSFIAKSKRRENTILWIEKTSSWKHMLVIGLPFLPTQPIRMGVAFSRISLKRFFFTLFGSYIILYIGNSLIYFGFASLLDDSIPRPLSILFFLIFALVIYFSNSLFNKEKIAEN